MEVKSTAKFVRGSARKARIPATVVRGMKVADALPTLKYMPKKAALSVYKVVNTAKADAVNNFGLEEDKLFIQEIRVDEGPRLRRMVPGSRGRGNIIAKKLCHISVIVSDGTDKIVKGKKSKVKKTSRKKKGGRKTTNEQTQIDKGKSLKQNTAGRQNDQIQAPVSQGTRRRGDR